MTIHKPTAADVLGVPLVLSTRGEAIENVHGGHAAVVSASGAIVAEAGDPSIWTYLRSTAKPIQALPSILGGVPEAYGLGDDAIAMMCASHHGTPAHIAVLERMLALMGVREEQLVFGPQMPVNVEARDEIIRRGGQPRKLYHVCAGKHIGMLALCKLRGWPMDSYAELEHPLQQELLRTVAALADVEPEAVGVAFDGCGLPVFALPLWRLALIYARFAAWDAAAASSGGPSGAAPAAGAPANGALAAAAGRIAAAMRSYPALVEGPGRLASIMLGDGNVVAKSGAQGVFVFALGREGIAGVVKLADGTESPWPEAVCSILEQMGLGQEVIASIRRQIPPEMRNDAGQVTGRREPCLELRIADRS
ncbi:asparaginase [Paenibacillus rhizovicinus]|uniref:Asparaginase n=1 Tax=Paenibacillus rhizovicinus TaxID=2704463 RepID=A0A6C0NX99_9BACL|nr:asparaginase [Paenibacillus rhizovicinus]QHW30837.1 asparaginase [Paenibacillus rhizovicinus]